MILVILVAVLLVFLVGTLGVRDLAKVAAARRLAVSAAEITGAEPRSVTAEWNERFVRTRLGRRLGRELELSGLTYPPLAVALVVAALGILFFFLLWSLLAPALAVLGLLAAVLVLRWYLERERIRRREKFTAQLPEVARLLANASFAGLSLSSALGVAASEVAEPARTELTRVSTRLSFGAPIEGALEELRERIGSRETGVLISTLVVSSRSGGSLVSALRTIADALEQRKETRREVQTTLAQAVATSYLVVLMGFVVILVLNVLHSGTVELMTKEPVGQVALLVAGILFAGGSMIIRRMTRIDE